MAFIADLHIHSRFAGATSPQLTISALAQVADVKGVDLLGTGDFTHPIWLKEIKDMLVLDEESGTYRFIDDTTHVRFILTAEVSLVYKDKDKTKKIHMLLFAPNLDTVEEINRVLSQYGKLDADARPTLSLSCKDLVKQMRAISPDIEVIPAHIWTPWFGVLGKRFGYLSLTEAFEEEIHHIHAIETGLDSDPLMNWIGLAEEKTILSFSDAHSLSRIGREATYFLSHMSYKNLLADIRKNQIGYTIEFFPGEGKYYYSGHRKCKFFATPEQDLELKGICPVCHKKLTQGVYRRVFDVALEEKSIAQIQYIEKSLKRDDNGFIHYDTKPPFIRLVPLDDVIAQTLHVKDPKAKKVQDIYQHIMKEVNGELQLLVHPPEFMKYAYPEIYENLHKVLKDQVTLVPGYDNTYGSVQF